MALKILKITRLNYEIQVASRKEVWIYIQDPLQRVTGCIAFL